jgi:hypothetical protein
VFLRAELGDDLLSLRHFMATINDVSGSRNMIYRNAHRD